MDPFVTAIVLAGGTSSRLAPRNKLLVAMPDGEALIRHTVRRTLASKVRRVVVVTGHQAEPVRAALAGLDVAVAHAADYAHGLSATLRAGMAALPPATRAVLVVLGDMPLVEPALTDALIAAYDLAGDGGIVVPVWDGRRGNPRLWGAGHFKALRALSGDEGARTLLAAHPDHVREVAAPSAGVLRDFDTAAAFEAIGVRF